MISIQICLDASMDWGDLRIFLAISREGTLGAAARRLGLTQPTMGRRLRALEHAVGHRLFQRTSDGFVLTDEGNLILPHAERVEDEVLACERQLSGESHALGGTLRVSSSEWFGTFMLAPVLAMFGSKYPKITVELLTDARIYNLARREADLVFRITPFSDADVVSRKLLRIPYALYGSKSARTPVLGDGSGDRLVTMDTAFAEMPDAVWLKRVLPRAEIGFRSNNREAQARLCQMGAGLAVLPCPLGDNVSGLKRLDIGEAPPSRNTYVGYHRDLRRLSRLRALLDFVIDELAS
jgi:DNA-binding transcriptional LysR family regulator